jgi:hypothetical protein
MFTVIISEPAQAEFEEAYLWYEIKRTGLGDELALCFDEAIGVLKRNPNFQIRHKSLRTLRVKRFPYKLVLQVVNNTEIIIESFFHTSKNPLRWMGE